MVGIVRGAAADALADRAYLISFLATAGVRVSHFCVLCFHVLSPVYWEGICLMLGSCFVVLLRCWEEC